MRRFTPRAAVRANDDRQIVIWPAKSCRFLSGARRFAFTGQRILGGPAHQRSIVVAEQYLAKADRRGYLHLPIGTRPDFGAAQRLNQPLGGFFDILLQVGIGPQRDLVDREFAGIGATDRDEIDQRGGFVDFAGVDLGADGNILVGALTQDAPDTAGHALDFRLQGVGG